LQRSILHFKPKKNKTMNLQQIQTAVNEGKTVCVGNGAYKVVQMKRFYLHKIELDLFVKCTSNNSLSALTKADNTTLNYSETEFFIEGEDEEENYSNAPYTFKEILEMGVVFDASGLENAHNWLWDLSANSLVPAYYPTVDLLEINKDFFFKDKTGRGFKGRFSLIDLISLWAEQMDYDGENFKQWAVEAEEGDVFENSTLTITCITE